MTHAEAKDVLEAFRRTTLNIRQLHHAWTSLFYSDQLPIISDDQNQPCRSILAVLANLLAEKMVLESAKLRDKPLIAGKQTLVLSSVEEAASCLGIDCDTHPDLKGPYQDLMKFVGSKWLVDLRNNALAHNNRDVFMRKGRPLQIDYARISDGVESLAIFEFRLRIVASGATLSRVDPQRGRFPLQEELEPVVHDAEVFRRMIECFANKDPR